MRSTCAGLVAAALVCAAPSAYAAGTAVSYGHVAGWVAGAAMVGAAPGEQTTQIAVHMSVRDPAALKSLVAEVSNPKSERYGRYLTDQEFADRFAPDAADVAAVQALLAKAGMTDVVVGPHGMYVSASATVRQLRTAFAVSQDLYSYKGRTLRANKEEPTIPAALSGKILHIEGLDETTALRQPLHINTAQGPLVAPATSAAASAVTPPPVAAGLPSPFCSTYYGDAVATLSTAAGVYGSKIPWLVCGYTPQQIQAAYGLNKVKFDGAGVTVAIIDAYASPTLKADANRYAANHGLPKLTAANFTEIIPEGVYDVPAAQVGDAYGWWGEESLDVAAVHGAAPGANIVYIGASDSGTSLTLAEMNQVYNHIGDISTHSYGENGESIPPGFAAMEDQAYMAGAAFGITVLFSSGDSGDLSAINGVATGSWPATSPYVTAVGGTSLAVLNAKGAKAEYGWATYRDLLLKPVVNSASSVTTTGLAMTTAFGMTYDSFAYDYGSGGGISLIEAEPSYQAPVVPTALATTLNLASGQQVPVAPGRVSPDVAMVGDPDTGYLYGESYTIAGNADADFGCTPLTTTTEYCEGRIGGTSLSSPLMAGVVAVWNQKRLASGAPVVGFANPLLYSLGASGASLTSGALNQILPPATPTSVLRGYVTPTSTTLRLITINSVPFDIFASPYALEVCGLPICEGIEEVFNQVTPGYNDVTGLGVPYVPDLIKE